VAKLLDRVPWFVTAPTVLALTGGIALILNLLLADYFIRTFVDDEDPFALAPGDGAAPPGTPATTPAAQPATPTTTPSVPTATSTPAAASPVATQPPATASPTPTGPAIVSQGSFRDGDPGHHGRGVARLGQTADGAPILRFEGFSVTGGPDLFVYLTTDPDGGAIAEGLNLGRLKGTDGNQNYEVPAGTDLSRYRSVVIWCRAFNVTFAVATLEVL
jgi:hypothetical protein